MNVLDLDSERVSPTGSIISTGVINQLGRPKMKILELLIREAVQNSWDARLELSGSIRFSVHMWEATRNQRELLKKIVFAKIPSFEKNLHKVLRNQIKPLYLLAISDRGTVGLGGPTRADIPTKKDEARDFVDFLRNVGQPPDKIFTGGTFGFGKAAYYRASLTRTLCVYTRCLYNEKIESRFIASALSEPYQAGNALYTGRHWWGRSAKNGISDPLLDKEADILGEKLGLLKFEGNELGTTFLLIQPVLNGDPDGQNGNGEDNNDPQTAIRTIIDSLLFFFWPKMMQYGEKKPVIEFNLYWEGKKVELPDPEKHPRLAGFTSAMRQLKNPNYDSSSVFPIKKADIVSAFYGIKQGTLILQKAEVVPDINGNLDKHFSELTHHTALMRQPELIVKYLEGPAMPNETVGYAGVFIASKDQEADKAFSGAEPPTHDDWIPDALEERKSRTLVRTAVRDILKNMEEFARPVLPGGGDSTISPLGAFANHLGSSLLVGEQGNAAAFLPMRVRRTPIQLSTNQFEPTAGIGQPADADQSPQTPNEPIPDGSAENNLNSGTTTLPPAPIFTPPSRPADEEISAGSTDHDRRWEVLQKENEEQKKTRGRARLVNISNGEFILTENHPSLFFEFTVIHAEGSVGTTVSATVKAVLEGGVLENEPPIGGSHSEVIRWIAPDGVQYAGSKNIFITKERSGTWQTIISLPSDMMLGIDFRADSEYEE